MEYKDLPISSRKFYDFIMSVSKNENDFAKNKLNLKRTDSIYKITRHGSEPGELTLKRVKEVFPDFDIDYILSPDTIETKEPPTYLKNRLDKKNGGTKTDGNIVYTNPFIVDKVEETVNYYDVDFAAGGVEFYEDNVEQPAYRMNIPAFGGCVAFNVFGESMEPIIKGGSICFGRKLDNWFESYFA